MSNDNRKTSSTLKAGLIRRFLGLSWFKVLPDLVKLAWYFWERLTDSGMYGVLDYELTLELLDKDGHRARFSKREEVCYLQNNIIAYQDQAWGDGQILIGHKCSLGNIVDRYLPGHKSYLMISLRDSNNRDDEDEFNIEWE